MRSTITRQFACICGVLLATSSGCVKSVCERSSDCAGGTICETATGECVTPECSCTVPCSEAGKICEDNKCVVGCLSDQDCVNASCYQHRCRTMGQPAEQTPDQATTQPAEQTPDQATTQVDAGGLSDGSGPADGGESGKAATPVKPAVRCRCPLAPEVCLADINPASTTFQEESCIAAAADPGTVLFFGNVPCGHCQGVFNSLLVLEARLRDDQLSPKLAFVQRKADTHPPDVVSSTYPQHSGPVLQDTQAKDAWLVYAADWYDVIIVDSHGCLAEHYHSLDASAFVGTVGAEIEAAWRRSLSGDCP